MLDLDVELPRLPRALPKRIPLGSHILSHSDLAAVARHFTGHSHVRLGEELIGHVIPGMFDAPSGRVISVEVLAELGNGDPIAGKKVVRKFLNNIRQRGNHGEYAKGGAVKMSKVDAGYDEIGDEVRICAVGSMYRNDHKCTLVAGHISRTATCNHFDKA